MRLVQLANGNLRSVALVEEPHLVLLNEVTSIYQLVQRALAQKLELTGLIASLAKGDRIYFQVQQSGFSSFMDLPTAVETAGRYYLLPAVQVTDLRKATVVVSWLADPGLLHVHFVTQKRLGLQLMFVSRIRAP